MLLSQEADLRDDYSGDLARFHPSKVDTVKLLRMVLTHDVCEALAGDITPFCDPELVACKADKERDAMAKIRSVVGDPLGLELYDLWVEHEKGETTEAIYCHDIDKFEMVVQACEYETEHLKPIPDGVSPDQNFCGNGPNPTVADEPLRRFYMTTNKTMKSPLFRRLDQELRQKRELVLKSKGWAVTDDERQQYA
eukprot:CAMPEP_0196583298 /NCGR_PEP_ID=MMETSP1081-20130531/42898_1 /TAXON_ID=36882 /ORGANISM="Pyramimonas amylifera, Strain CCMP720" /LENGTH=194 /DNA_ID=CAMNT_0041904133 /DNA_START=57 /DNA_END=641 /DNA_ORIENTATION=-